jgi:hypothetical protein
MEHTSQEAEALAETIKGILDDAAAPPEVQIDESTNQVIPPDTSYMTEEYAVQAAAKVTDLQHRIADALADGERLTSREQLPLPPVPLHPRRRRRRPLRICWCRVPHETRHQSRPGPDRAVLTVRSVS